MWACLMFIGVLPIDFLANIEWFVFDGQLISEYKAIISSSLLFYPKASLHISKKKNDDIGLIPILCSYLPPCLI